ncbi:MAG: substrate-binding domain-containing protein [Candidatus Tumulicola sp.]
MNKILATVAPAVILGLSMSACNGTAGSGTSGVGAVPNATTSQAKQQPGRKAGPNDNGPSSLHAGGATFPAEAYNTASQPVGLYTAPQAPPGGGSLFANYGGTGTIFYCLTGSGAGRKQFDGDPTRLGATAACAGLGDAATGFGGRQDPLDFLASDVMISSTEYATYASNRKSTQGEPFMFPSLGGPIVYGYRPQDFSGVSHVKLSTWSYCAIANGTIGNWDDQALTADNGSSLTGGASQPITFYFRSDGSGTTQIYTNKVLTTCGSTWPAPYNAPPYESPGHSAAWTFGPSTGNWVGPNGTQTSGSDFIGANGNPGVLAGIQSTAYGTGYVEGAFAKTANPHVSQALLQNGTNSGSPVFVDPTNRASVVHALANVTSASIAFGECDDLVSCGSSRPECILYVPPNNFVSPPSGDYPIVGISYLLFYGQSNLHYGDDKTLVNYMVSKPATKIINKLEYVALSSSFHKAVLKALNGTRRVHPCLNP